MHQQLAGQQSPRLNTFMMLRWELESRLGNVSWDSFWFPVGPCDKPDQGLGETSENLAKRTNANVLCIKFYLFICLLDP